MAVVKETFNVSMCNIPNSTHVSWCAQPSGHSMASVENHWNRKRIAMLCAIRIDETYVKGSTNDWSLMGNDIDHRAAALSCNGPWFFFFFSFSARRPTRPWPLTIDEPGMCVCGCAVLFRKQKNYVCSLWPSEKVVSHLQLLAMPWYQIMLIAWMFRVYRRCWDRSRCWDRNKYNVCRWFASRSIFPYNINIRFCSLVFNWTGALIVLTMSSQWLTLNGMVH